MAEVISCAWKLDIVSADHDLTLIKSSSASTSSVTVSQNTQTTASMCRLILKQSNIPQTMMWQKKLLPQQRLGSSRKNLLRRHSLVGTFRRLMRDSGLLVDGAGQTRTLYSLRHTYATLELLKNSTDIHTLSKQMGNSASMIERHYSKFTATMAADRLA